MTPDRPDGPLSHPLRVETIKPRGTVVVVTADDGLLPKIASQLGLASLERLSARYALTRNGERVKLEGVVEAQLHQTCIVTLDSFPVVLSEPVKLDFVPEEVGAAAARQAETEIDVEVRLNEADPPEPIIDGVIDLGAVTLEFLALALDPYPRKPGVAFESSTADAERESPFAALARLKGSS